jgi:hypothetical protein
MPPAQDLPDELSALPHQQAIQVRYVGFRQQTQLLIRAIDKKCKAQDATWRSKLFGFPSVLIRTWRIVSVRTKPILIVGMCVLASVAIYLAVNNEVLKPPRLPKKLLRYTTFSVTGEFQRGYRFSEDSTVVIDRDTGHAIDA